MVAIHFNHPYHIIKLCFMINFGSNNTVRWLLYKYFLIIISFIDFYIFYILIVKSTPLLSTRTYTYTLVYTYSMYVFYVLFTITCSPTRPKRGKTFLFSLVASMSATVLAEEVLPDCVSFLEELQTTYSNAAVLLSNKQLKALDLSPTTPFEKETVNEDFLRLAEEYFVLKNCGTSSSISLRQVLINANPKSKLPDVEEHSKVVNVLNKAAERIRKIWEFKLKVTEERNGTDGLPRIIRLARRLELSNKETQALVYILCCQVGESDRFSRSFMKGGGLGLGGNSNTVDVCRVCEMRITEIVEFLSQDRVHMQQGLFPDVQQNYMLHSAISFDEVTVKALIGAHLLSSEFLKLEQTILADVVAEESGNEHLREGEPAGLSPAGVDVSADMPPVSSQGYRNTYMYIVHSTL